MSSADATSRFETLYRFAPCGLATLTRDHDIVDVNETLLSWLGVQAAEVVGRPFRALLDRGSAVFYDTRHTAVLLLEREVTESALTMVRSDGSSMPVLLRAALDVDAQGDPVSVRVAVFDATARQEYERDLLQARRAAEISETHIRILHDISSAYDVTATAHDFAETCVRVAREAFAAAEVSVMLLDEYGMLDVAAGHNPLFGRVAPIAELRATDVPIAITVDDAESTYPDLARGLRETRLDSVSITPMQYEGERLGILVCYFGRRRTFDEQFFALHDALARQATQALVRLRLQQQLERLAHYDVLTGIPNRSLLQSSLENAVVSADESGHPLSLIFIDLDSFKAVNDLLGHVAGDRVLTEVAARLRSGVRTDDIVGRIGGDEFVAICENADGSAASSIAERVRSVIREPIAGLSRPVSITASIGVVTYVPGVDARPSSDGLLNRADTAMYRSKGTGKDRVSIEP